MAERSMPEMPGLTWRPSALFDSIHAFAESVADGVVASRAPIRVQAEVGEPIPEIEAT
jgi:hypothetical protein